jgi:hypothetical protein
MAPVTASTRTDLEATLLVSALGVATSEAASVCVPVVVDKLAGFATAAIDTSAELVVDA